jgi:hypothetical protein
VGADHAGEFLFSVAMRARRAGLTVGALAMFEAYLASGVVGEDELRVRAARLRDEAVAEWTRLTAAAPCSAGDAR